MVVRSIVDDLTPRDLKRGRGGYPILFENPLIRRMLKLAKAGEDDIFCDLGCGLAQNLIIAASEFNVYKAVGFEWNEKRFKKAKHRLKVKKLEQCEVFHESFNKVLEGKSRNFKLEDATIVFYGLGTDNEYDHSVENELLQYFANVMKEKCKLLYYSPCLFPEIMPNKVDYPFFLSVFPFTETSSEMEWLQNVTGKKKSLLHRGKEAEISELWDDLSHDLRISSSDPYAARRYKHRMKYLELDS
jgi:SAM-dependent methyltransferase